MLITFSISMYIMCVILCLFSALSCRVGALQISIIIIVKAVHHVQKKHTQKQFTMFRRNIYKNSSPCWEKTFAKAVHHVQKKHLQKQFTMLRKNIYKGSSPCSEETPKSSSPCSEETPKSSAPCSEETHTKAVHHVQKKRYTKVIHHIKVGGGGGGFNWLHFKMECVLVNC